MSGFRVTAEALTVFPHPNADALELAQVGLYRAVVPKGVYQTGDVALYIPEQAVLPNELIEELGLVGRLAGKAKNRVKAIRLRGELSQGIVCRPKALDSWELERTAGNPDFDYAEALNVVEWVPEVPAAMNGVVKAAPELIRWIEIENVKRFPTVFEPGEWVIATEKVHGTACLVTVNRDGDLWVSSKGYGGKSLALEESETNLYWRAVRGWNVDLVANRFLTQHPEVERVGIFGEVYGAGVQDLDYGTTGNVGKPGYAVFDVAVVVDGETCWLSYDEVLGGLDGSLPYVPQIYYGPFDLAVLTELAEGREQVSGTSAHLREGLVVRADPERRSDELGGRAILKFVSEAYLTRKGGTEYE